MTPERYEEICQICYDALDLEASQRAAFLDRACAVDATLRREVEEMLANEGRVESFLNAPALEVAAEQMAEGLGEEKTTLLFDDRQSDDISSSPLETRVGPFAPGSVLGGRYLVEGKLKEGGVGLVFLARDQKLHRAPVVIKVLREDLRNKAWFEKKFKQEIAALAQIDHPGVVRALDVGEAPDGRPYLVMQYVSGVSLRSVIPPLGMELERVASLMRQMGQALTVAHNQGVIHRDLKPENIMLQTLVDEEYVKLINFGIATVREMAEGEGRTTAVIGTRNYVAPEQLRGKPVPASDIYALGVIAYEMVTGRRTFNADSLPELIDLQRDGVKVNPCDLRPGLPAAAQGPILKALSFTPQDRYASAKDFTEALARALTNGEDIRALHWSLLLAGRARWLGPVALIATAVIILAVWQLISYVQAPIAVPERRLSYTLVAQRDPKRYPDNRPFSTFDNMIFGEGDQCRFYISSSQSGYLYIINEGPTQTDEFPEFNVVFPETDANGGSAEIQANQIVQIPLPGKNTQQDWIVLDREEGVEKIWLVWSERSIPILEAVKGWANPTNDGAIRDSKQRASVAHYLAVPSVIELEVERDEAIKLTRLKGKGETMVWLMKLEHR